MNLFDYDVFKLADQILKAYPEPAPFEDFGPYRMRAELGNGGMGKVFLADDIVAGRPVAIKFLACSWGSTDLRERFTREVKTLAKLEHPFIARLYDAGIHPSGTPYFAMEYVEGKPLDRYCREQVCSAEERLRLFRAVCAAVQYAHAHLVIHRDLKPSNVLITHDGTPKLLDFGIAKQLENSEEPATQTQTERRFTRAFAAPEQLRGDPVGMYTDVYALGVMLYESLAGRPPFDLERCAPLEAEAIIAGEKEPPKPSTSPQRVKAGQAAWNDLDVLCLKAMKKDPARRYHSVVELMQEIDRYLAGQPLQARPDTLAYRLTKFLRRNQRAVLAAALTLVLLIGIVVFFLLRLAQERDRAIRQTDIASATNRFLSEDLLGRSDPFQSGKTQESFLDVVNRASPQIDMQFRNEPAVAAQLHATLAKAFENRSDFPQARQEYRHAIGLFQHGEGTLSADAIALQLRQAVMEARSFVPGSLTVAQSLVQDARNSMSQIAQPRDDLPMWLAYAQGAIAIVGNDAHSASKNFAAALRQAETSSSVDKTAQTSMKQMVAFSYVRLDEGAKAEPLLREVIHAYSLRYGENTPEVLRAKAYLAMAFMRQHKYGDAMREIDAIYPLLVATLGADNQITLSVMGTRAASEGYLEKWDAAIRDDLAIYNLAVRKQGPVAFQPLSSLSDAALSQCRSGRYVEGAMNARKAYEESKTAFGPQVGLTGGCAYALATCLIGLNQLPEASELLQNIDRNAVAQLSGDSSVVASVALAQAQIAVRRKDYVLGRRYLETAARGFGASIDDLSDQKLFADLKRTIDSHLAARQ